MRRQSADRLAITMDKELIKWLDDYAWSQKKTKSEVVCELVEELRNLYEGRLSDESEN